MAYSPVWTDGGRGDDACDVSWGESVGALIAEEAQVDASSSTVASSAKTTNARVDSKTPKCILNKNHPENPITVTWSKVTIAE